MYFCWKIIFLYHLAKIIIIILLIYIIYERQSLKFQKKDLVDEKSPKISIFLPIYNKEKYLRSSIYSLQCQSLKDIEIIAVNDFSNDKSLEILKQLSFEDKRIKIVNNKKNHGLLYSRTIGMLNSKGVYLMNLDPDDVIQDCNSLELLYYKAKNANVDIISFGSFFQYENKKIFKCSNFDKIIFQPEIFQSAFNEENYLEDFLIWNKLVKKELFIKVYDLFISQIYKMYWNYHEDNIWSILLNKYANSMLCVRKIIYIYNNNIDSLMQYRLKKTEIINLLYKYQMFKRIFKKIDEKKYLIALKSQLISIFETKEFFLKLIRQKDIQEKYINIFISLCNDYNLTKAIKSQIYNFFHKWLE